MAKNKMIEKKLEKTIILNLKMLGYYVHKTPSHAGCYDYNIGMNEAGIADLIVIGEGRVVFLEIKTAKGKQSIQQKVFEEICRKNGVIYRVVRSVKEAIKIVK